MQCTSLFLMTLFDGFIAGSAAGSAGLIVGHPFDTIKVRLQTMSGYKGKEYFVLNLVNIRYDSYCWLQHEPSRFWCSSKPRLKTTKFKYIVSNFFQYFINIRN